MADSSARVLTNPSNRANSKSARGKSKAYSSAQSTNLSRKDKAPSKVVYKGVLENPLKIEWPVVPTHIQQSLLSGLIEILKPLRPFHVQREAESRKRRTERGKSLICETKTKGKGKATDQPENHIDIRDTLHTPETSEGVCVEEWTGLTSNGGVTGQDDLSINPPVVPKGRKRRHETADDTRSSEECDENAVDTTEDNALVVNSAKRRRTNTGSRQDGDASTKPKNAPRSEPSSRLPTISPPDIFAHVVFGINEVTRRLEGQSRLQTVSSSLPEAATSISTPDIDDDPISSSKDTAELTANPQHRRHIRLVVINRHDVNPSLMIAHIPQLVAACNIESPSHSTQQIDASSSVKHPNRQPVLLLTLPVDSESKLADAAGLRRMMALAFDDQCPGLDQLDPLLRSIPVLKAAWLLPPSISQPQKELIPTHIKQLKTTAPKEMKASKDARARGKAEAKTRRVERLKLGNDHTLSVKPSGSSGTHKVKPSKEKTKSSRRKESRKKISTTVIKLRPSGPVGDPGQS